MHLVPAPAVRLMDEEKIAITVPKERTKRVTPLME